MGMQTDCVYGFGWEVAVSDEKLEAFILNHRNTLKENKKGMEVLAWIDDDATFTENIKEYWFDYESEISGESGLYGIIADIMSRETGIRFDYRRPQDDDGDVIMFQETYPWLMTDAEKNLTIETLTEICVKYMRELGDEHQPDYVRLEYFG